MKIYIPDVPKVKIKCPECDGTGEQDKRPDELILLPCDFCGGSGYSQKIRNLSSTDDNILFYVDLNIISEMRDGRYQIPNHRIFDLSQQRKHRSDGYVIYVYSNEMLAEISRTEYPEEYLSQLRQLKALKLLEYLDIQNPSLVGKPAIHTGKLQPLFKYVDPADYYDFYVNKIDMNEEYLHDFISFSNMVLHVASLLDMKPVEFEMVGIERKEKLQELMNIVDEIRVVLGTKNPGVFKASFIPNPVEHVWNNFVKPKLKNISITENVFFSFLKAGSVSSDLVNSHIVLNIIGYYPDKNKKISENLSAFMSDVRHVNMALRTDVFLTYDQNLAHRAAALYKWESLKTGVNMMTVFKRFGKKDVLDYVAVEGETADQASDRSICLYTGGIIRPELNA